MPIESNPNFVKIYWSLSRRATNNFRETTYFSSEVAYEAANAAYDAFGNQCRCCP